MAIPALSDELLLETVEALKTHGTQKAAADALGIPRTTFQNRLYDAARRGLMGTKPVLPGFQITQTTAVTDAAGNVVREFIQQKPEQERSAFNMPDGHSLKGVSAYLDGNGNVVGQWVKTKADGSPILLEAIKATLEAYEPAQLLPPPASTNADLMTVYPIADLHLGLFSWAKETGADYDLKIAADLLTSSMNNLVSRSANSQTSIVLDLGDYFHSDNSRNQTARSGNPLDVDTRYAKVVQVGFELAITSIELALQKHEFVEYRKLPGNHDDETSLMLSVAVAAHFRNEERVKVDATPSRFFMRQFGKCMIAATHGDMLKMGDLAGFVAAHWPKEWGETVYRYGYTGHIHNEKALAVNTLRGMRAESFNTIAAKDAWHASMGYQAPRNMVSITLDANLGETSRLTVAVPQ